MPLAATIPNARSQLYIFQIKYISSRRRLNVQGRSHDRAITRQKDKYRKPSVDDYYTYGMFVSITSQIFARIQQLELTRVYGNFF